MTRITRKWATKNSDKVVGRDGSNSPAGRIGAVSLALKTSICEKSPAGRFDHCHTVSSSSAGRQQGDMFFRLGQPEGFKFELFWVETQANRLVGVGPRWTQGGHHLNSAIHKFFEIETKAPVGS